MNFTQYFTLKNIGIIFIFCLIAYLVTYYFIKRKNPKYKNKTLVSIIAAGILGPILYLVVIVVFFSILFYEPKYNFDKTKWEKYKTKRYRMVESLIDQKLLHSKDSLKVKELLGNPDFRNNDLWTYDVGHGGGGLGFMWHHLNITFLENEVAYVKHIVWKD